MFIAPDVLCLTLCYVWFAIKNVLIREVLLTHKDVYLHATSWQALDVTPALALLQATTLQSTFAFTVSSFIVDDTKFQQGQENLIFFDIFYQNIFLIKNSVKYIFTLSSFSQMHIMKSFIE